MIVADAGVVVEALLLTTEAGQIARDRLGSEDVHAPHLLDLEVASVLRRLTLSAAVRSEIAGKALSALGSAQIFRHAHTPFLARIWELRSSVGPYDAAYVALAERAGAPLLTLDQRLARAHGPRCKVEVLGL